MIQEIPELYIYISFLHRIVLRFTYANPSIFVGSGVLLLLILFTMKPLLEIQMGTGWFHVNLLHSTH